MKRFIPLLIATFIFVWGGGGELSAQNPWYQVQGPDYWSNYWEYGKVSINCPTLDISQGTPTLMLHSPTKISPDPLCDPATMILQTNNCDDPPNLFGENSIEFWSNHYDSTFKWATGRIMTYTHEVGPFEDGGNYFAGLKFACSGGPSRMDAELGPVDVMYLYDKKVGIWQHDPKEKLHVGGWIRSDSLAGGDSLKPLYADIDGNIVTDEIIEFCPRPWCLWGNELTTGDGSEFLGTLNDYPLIFKTNGSTRMRITSNGDVGIRAYNPKEVLQIGPEILFHDGGQKSLRFNNYYDGGVEYSKIINHERVAVQIGIEHSGSSNPSAFFYIDKGEQDEDPAFIDYWQNGYMKGIKLTDDGNVGICEVDPDSRLVIRGSGNTDATSSFKIVNSNGDQSLLAKDNGQINIGAEAITSGDHADYKLSVDGKIVAKEIIVTLSDWSDYVFEDDYNLKSLEELESEIRKYKRLPDMPSAEEVEKNGVAVGEMQAKLLKKIEELTLYVIELKKENNELKRIVNNKFK